ncbi:hypothetical protein I2I05_07140 [Hymenobacter sp. BT683]|uniref:PH domain-containing protein n=1 Tax=Hymenobacter jeongseonensis TaxID=2791027 RepID=A0ABS0IFM5_9BACT|nr:hypothetical protein [Hymenobacter jeongseonensis]MBF9237167.1 hypothetical protein [Hymenobacter jeongseonensis]
MNAASPPPESPDRTTLFHRRHLRRQVAKSVGHIGPAIVFVLAVVPVLSGAEAFTALVGLEVVVGVVYLTLMVRELRNLRHNPFHSERVAWLELAAAAILLIESYHIWHRHHAAELAGAPARFHALPWVYALVAVAYIVLAFRMRQLTGRTFLHLHADGFAVRTGRFGKEHNLRWADIASADPEGSTGVVVRRTDGQEHRIVFDSLHEGTVHRDRLLAHLRKSISR